MTDLTDWSSNANDVINIRLKHTDSIVSTKDASFPPAFTYPIFGEEETIFGYRGLRIRLDFVANTLEPSLKVTYDEKYQAVGETKADEVEETLRLYLPDPAPDNVRKALDTVWEPPGELLHQYEAGGRTFGIWATDLSNPAAKDILRNMQILVLFFIEGGSMIELDDSDWTIERWTLFMIYAIDPIPSKPQSSSYTLAGYSTTYRLFFLDTTSPLYAPITAPATTAPSDIPSTADKALTSRLPCRQRISQFLILPPYQNSGHGSILYSTVLNHFLAAPTVTEITVEDPNEAFDDLRDVNDLNRLRATNPTFTSLNLNASAKLPTSRSAPFDPALLLSPTLLTQLRKETKLAPRQFSRLVEMQTLCSIPARHRQVARITRKDKSTDHNDRTYYFWRLYVKQRLYRHNVDQLAQLEMEERVEKLEETCNGVERDYERLMELAERRADKGLLGAEAVPGAEDGDVAVPIAATGVSRGKKRKNVIEDEEDEDEDEDVDMGGSGVGHNTASGATSATTGLASTSTSNGTSSAKKKARLEVVDLAADD